LLPVAFYISALNLFLKFVVNSCPEIVTRHKIAACGYVAKRLSNRKGEGKPYTNARNTARYQAKKRFNTLGKKEPSELENGQINTVMQ
jgi:hypothetical protein